jgi:hypothetical protein
MLLIVVVVVLADAVTASQFLLSCVCLGEGVMGRLLHCPNP